MTYDQQLEKLKEKHLQVQDEAAAREALRRIGYFSLVGGYKSLFKNPTTRLYRDGTDFQDLLSLYRFDERLRELTLRHLLHIEQNIRAELSYAFCSRYGERQEAYLTAENYDQTAARRQKIDALLEKHLRPLLDRKTDYPYKEQLVLLIEALAQENRQLTRQLTRRDLFGQMGLPDNWQLM